MSQINNCIEKINFENLLNIEGLNEKQKKLLCIKNKSIFFNGDILKETEEEHTIPLLIVYYMGETGFLVHESIKEDFEISLSYIKVIKKDRLKIIFGAIFKSANVKTALEYIFNSEIIKILAPEMNFFRLPSYVKKDYYDMTTNFNSIKNNFGTDVLFGVFFRRFSSKTIKDGIRFFGFENELENRIIDSLTHVDKIYFLNTSYELKRYILRNGFDSYNYFHNIAKAEKVLFERSEHKTQARIHLLSEINIHKEPYLVEHLNITPKILIENNMCNSEFEAEKIMKLLLYVVIKYPNKNNEKVLLNEAKKLKNPIQKYINMVVWRR